MLAKELDAFYGRGFRPLTTTQIGIMLKACYNYRKAPMDQSRPSDDVILKTLKNECGSLKDLYRNVTYVEKDMKFDDEEERIEYLEMLSDTICPVYDELFNNRIYDREAGCYGHISTKSFYASLENVLDAYKLILSNGDKQLIADKLVASQMPNKTFNQSFPQLLLLEKSDSRLKKYKEALVHFDIILSAYDKLKKAGYIKKAEIKVEHPEYGEYYDAAEKIINAYIGDYDNFNLVSFLDEQGINNGEFLFAIEVVRSLNRELYDEFVFVHTNEKKPGMEKIQEESIDKILSGIIDGTIDGREFTRLDFLTLLPFKSSNWSRVLATFMKDKFSCSQSSIISKYITSSGLLRHSLDSSSDTFRTLNPDIIMEQSIVVEGHQVTNEEKQIIINALEKLRIPLSRITFNIGVDEYFHGKFDNLEQMSGEICLAEGAKNIDLFVKDRKSQCYQRSIEYSKRRANENAN